MSTAVNQFTYNLRGMRDTFLSIGTTIHKVADYAKPDVPCSCGRPHDRKWDHSSDGCSWIG